MAQAKKLLSESGQKFPKGELLKADQLKEKYDLVEALLDPKKKYTLQEAEDLINEFLKGRVN